LESLYTQNDLVAEFEPLLEFESVEAYERKASATARRIVESGEAGISAFVERCARFVEEERRFHSLLGVASQLGSLAGDKPAVREFVTRNLQIPESPRHLEFALSSAMRWFFDLRKTRGSASAYDLLQELLGKCGDEPTKVAMLSELYGLFPPHYTSE